MSRFGIRKKLKSLMGAPTESKYQTYSVTYVLPDGSEHVVQAEERYNLLMASQSLPSPIGTGRRAGGMCPDGGCGTCQVEILDSTGLTPMTDSERKTLDAYVAGDPHEGHPRQPGEPYTENTRLGCYTKIIGHGARIQVKELVNFEKLAGEQDGM